MLRFVLIFVPACPTRQIGSKLSGGGAADMSRVRPVSSRFLARPLLSSHPPGPGEHSATAIVVAILSEVKAGGQPRDHPVAGCDTPCSLPGYGSFSCGGSRDRSARAARTSAKPGEIAPDDRFRRQQRRSQGDRFRDAAGGRPRQPAPLAPVASAARAAAAAPPEPAAEEVPTRAPRPESGCRSARGHSRRPTSRRSPAPASRSPAAPPRSACASPVAPRRRCEARSSAR